MQTQQAIPHGTLLLLPLLPLLLRWWGSKQKREKEKEKKKRRRPLASVKEGRRRRRDSSCDEAVEKVNAEADADAGSRLLKEVAEALEAMEKTVERGDPGKDRPLLLK